MIAVLLVAAAAPRQAAAAGADRAEKLISRAETSYAKHDYEHAARLFAKADEAAEGRSAEAIAGLARSYISLLRYDEAAAAAERLIEQAGTPEIRAAGYQHLGLALHRRGLSERWAEIRERSGRRSPDERSAATDPEGGEASMRAAVDAFRRAAAELDADAAERRYVLLNLADVLSWLDEDAEALAALDDYAAAGGADPWAEQIRCWTRFEDPRHEHDPREGEGLKLVMPGGDVEAPTKLYAPAPRFPPGAREARMEGLVILQAIVNDQGTIDCVRPVMAEHYPLAWAAMSAVEDWRFEPARRNGEPVDVFYNLTVNFTLR